MRIRKLLLFLLVSGLFTGAAYGQDPKPSPTVPPGFQPAGPFFGPLTVWRGKRTERVPEIANEPANVTDLILEKQVLYSSCTPGPHPECSIKDAFIKITTKGEDKEGDILTYAYGVRKGKIVGTGAEVIWDLSGAAPGSYTITAGVNDGCGICGKTATRTVEVKAAPDVERIDLSDQELFTECPGAHFVSDHCSLDQMFVAVKVTARGPTEGLSFYYVVTGGKIVGEGPLVKWDLRDAVPGKYDISVGVGKDNILLGKSLSKTLQIKDCPCDPPCPCPYLHLTGPADPVAAGDTVILETDTPPSKGVTFHWTHSGGKIISDPAASILLKIPGDMKNGIIIVNVELQGTDPACNCHIQESFTITVGKGSAAPKKANPELK